MKRAFAHSGFQAFVPTLLLATGLALCLILPGCGAANFGQTEDSFKKAFIEQGFDKRGAALDDYVKETPYSLTAFSVSDMEKTGDNTLTAVVTATVENESFISELVFDATYTDDEESPLYEFQRQSSTTTPKKGIDSGEGVEFDESQMTLSEDKTHCEVVLEETCGAWFVDSSETTTMSFVFENDSWRKEDEDTSRKVSYKDIEGSYWGKSNLMEHFVRFDISNFDEERGTFTIEMSAEQYECGYERDAMPFDATLHGAIEPETGGQYALEDGYSYGFVASGTSTGGKGSAKLVGYFTNPNTGEKTIELVQGSQIDAFTVGSLTPKGEQDSNTLVYNEGTLYKK
ncbi:hypothetical protein VJ923_10925 [Adlercreutzia sp. R25]|uniref:DUF4179 domain-containing protein n=1 Tax=Adlercreutzia shanghongiae TaxID=3111773 RepID=A0ABU6IWL5_9ACTN|nr:MULTISPECIES: hypothetical protein [unclassified Adlercreutzia]MEC4273671.1 hypothetical protein [Adlercreutzia sp. R25]MEC4294103.1 hypothetical protein [Adlercreutzia sp. R22]